MIRLRNTRISLNNIRMTTYFWICFTIQTKLGLAII
uniref:Uncharacterized protein n=1 Tax=virus sp. ctBM815 TaxID=2825806 RepID=A0A8S5RKA6_9VIRU|nr:MAG TPA: hypothetical protein [virus sp. ctBM815]